MQRFLTRLTLFAAATISISAPDALAGVVDGRYDLQYYLDFCCNKGMFATGATNIEVFFKDGTSIANNTIPLMPNMDSYGQTVSSVIGNKIGSNGGTNLVSAQFVYGAKHVHEKVKNSDVAFLAENGSANCIYDSANLDSFGTDSAMQRLTKLVTSVAYTPMADDAFMQTLKLNDTWLYRLGTGGTWCDGKSIGTGDNSLGGVVNLSVCWQNTNTGEWYLEGWARKNELANDALTPLDIGTYFGDSGSPFFVWDDKNSQFVFVGAMWAGGCQLSFPNWYLFRYNYQQGSAVMDKYTVIADKFSGTEKIVWGKQDATLGTGTLTQGDISVTYTGKGSGNTIADTLGITFSTTDSENVQTLELAESVNMGAGALTFESGKWKLSEARSSYTLASAGFEIKEGAELTLNLTGTTSEEIRKVGEGTLTIAGSGNNESKLVVGGGTTVYNVTKDADGNVTGCTLGNAGETRLNRTDGYAASSVRLEGGVAIVVLMQDGQFKTNSTAGDTFSFGNDGGLLNLNGHNLEWGVINQNGSGTGARIGNFTPLNEEKPGTATFTYTGTGAFAGSFMDEGADGAQLAVVYNNATEGSTWTLTGNSSNYGGFAIGAGMMKLEGSRTPHVRTTDWNDWTYASIETSKVSVKSGATFHLSHHALLSGDVEVAAGGNFLLNQTVNAASESVSGSLRQDMAELGITALKGNVTLNGNASMTVNINSPVATTMQGNITGDTSGASFASFTKTGSGTFIVEGQVGIPRGTVEQGGLIVRDGTNFLSMWSGWNIGEKGFLAVQGLDGQALVSCISTSSSGVLALTKNQVSAPDLSFTPYLYIGAYGEQAIEYGSSGVELAANSEGNWLLGGGTGTLNVNFKLTGANNLIVGNDYSSGTVHLTNTANDFTGDIYIKGTGNMLTYVEGALGSARVALSYGNTLGLNDVSQLSILKEGAAGILALTRSQDLDLSDKETAIGAAGDLTYTGTLIVGDKYRFGGSGNLTLDTTLSGASEMELDGQGNTGSSVTFARENAFTGTIVAGGGLHLDSANSSGDITLHAGHAETFASVNSMTMRKGAMLDTDGRESLVIRNLSAESGSSIKNSGNTATLLQLNVAEGVSTTVADGVLLNANNNAPLALVKTGSGTLTMGANSTWNGGLTVMEGTVAGALYADGTFNTAGGIGSDSNAIYVDKNGTLSIKGATRTGRALGGTEIVQRVTGNGTIEFASGGSAFFSSQSSSFEGTIKLTGNTRVYLGSGLDYNGSGVGKNTLSAVQNATIEVMSGSQVRITSTLYKQSTAHMNSYSDFVISGAGFAGSHGGNDISQLDALTGGALAIDLGSTVYGNVTLANDATISSSSFGTLGESNTKTGYGTKGHLGGTIRGKILGEGKTLTFGGNEGMTITADSANTFGDLVVANGNGNNDDKFALRLDGGAAKSQISTALGTGSVTLGENLILRLAGTGTADSSHVVYTYGNAISAGNGATLQSYNITNRITGTVTMSGDTLNLATANGGVLELSGGISGNGTLNVGANSKIVLGSASSAMALARSGSAQFSGNVVTASGADITLMSPSVVSETTTFSGTDSLALRLAGTEDYTLGGITVTDSDTSDASGSLLTLNFDFSNIPDEDNADTWTTLFSDISVGNTVVSLSLNMFNDIESGSYTLAKGALSGEFSLEDTLNNRLSLTQNDGSLVLNVGADNRLYWAADGLNQEWNTTDANWYQESSDGNVAFTSGAHVVLDSTGAANSTADSRETITLSANQTVGTLAAKGENAFYEVTGTVALSGTNLAVGLGGNLKLSTTNASFSDGVRVDDASLEVNGTALTSNVSATNGGLFTLSNSASLSGTLSLSDSSATINDSAVNGSISTLGTGSLSMKNAVLGSNSINFENGSALSLAGAKLSGDLSWKKDCDIVSSSSLNIDAGNMNSNAALQVETMNIASGSTLTVAGSRTSYIDTVTGSGALLMADGNTATLNLGNASLNSLNLLGGTTNISGTVTLGSDARLSLGKATLNLNDGANVTTTHFRSGDQGSDHPSTINVNAGATLNITGSTNNDTTTTSFLLTHWGSSTSSFVLNGGTVNATNTSMLMGWDSGANFSALSGEANLKGIRFSSARGNADTFSLGVATEGSARINIGSDGITGIGNNDTVNLGEGTIGASANYSINGNAVNLIGTKNGTIFDTNGHTVTVNAALNGTGILAKNGAGTLTVAGNGSGFTGEIKVAAGTLSLGSDATLGALSGLSVADGATLDLSNINFSERTALSLAEGASSSIGSGAIFAFGVLESDTQYNIFDLSSGTSLDGWNSDNLGVANFSINGESMRDMGRVYVSLDETSGSFTYYKEDVYNLVWNGGSEGRWNREEGNTSWVRSIDGSISETATYFANYDNVAFDNDASVEITEAVKVGAMTIAEGASVSLTETGTLTAESISVGNGATLTFATGKAGYSAENISGAGTVVLGLSNSWNNALKLGADFAGETYVTSGYIDLTGASVGKTLRLANGVNANSATGKTTVSANLVLEGTSIVHANESKPITYEGTVTGTNGVFKSNGGFSHTFNAEVNLAGFETSHASNTNTFNAKTTLGTAKISQATVNFSGETTITTANISGGTTTFGANGSATISTATFSGGTTNFNGNATLTTANFNGGTVNFATDSLTIDTFNRGNGNINFKLKSGAATTGYTIGNISGDNYGILTVDSDVTLNAANITTPTGHFASASRGMNVNGEMNLSGAVDMRYTNGITWSGSGILNIDGNVNFQLSQRGAADISVNKLNVGGNLSLSSYWQANSVHQVNILSGETTVEGQVQHTSTGYTGSDRVTLNISGGTLTMKGGATMSQGTTNITSGKLEQAGGISTISNTFTMSGGELVVSGGTMNVTSAPTVTGGSVSVSGGTLVLTSDSAALLGASGGITLSSGKLDLGTVAFSAEGGIALGGAMSVTGGVIDLGNSLTAGTTYNIFDLTAANASLENWENLANNISVNGTMLSRYADATLSLTDNAATLSLTGFDKSSVYWTGGSAGTWDYSSANWDLKARDANTGNNVVFLTNDSVVFDSDAEISVSESVSVGSLTVESGTDLTLTAGTETGLTVNSALNVADDATLNLRGGSYTFAGDIGSANNAGTVNFVGTNIEFGTAVHTIYGTFNIKNDATLTSNRVGENYDNTGVVNISDSLNIEAGKTLTLDGNGRVVLAAGAEISLANESAMIRTANGAYWLRGKLRVKKGATANFTTPDDVHFNYNNTDSFKASIVLEENSNLTIQAKNFNIYDGANTSVSLAEGSCLTLSGFAFNEYTHQNVSGSGTLVLSLSRISWNNKINVGSNFFGEVHLNSGCMTLDGSISGNKLVLLSDNADIQLTTSTSAVQWSGNLELRGTHDLHSNSNTNFTFTGNITGTGTYVKKSSGSLSFGNNSSVKLNGFEQGGGTTNFNGTAALSSISVSGGTVNFKGETSIGTANIAGGAVSVSGVLVGSLTKKGTGTLTLSGDNSGAKSLKSVSVDAGTLIAGHTNALGTGAISVASGAVLQANAAVTLSAASQTLTLVVGEAQVVSSAYSLRSAENTGTALITVAENGSISVSGNAKLYVDISALDGKISGDSIALKLAAESALNANSEAIQVGAWTTDSTWIKSSDWFVQDYSLETGILTLAIPEPSLFGLLAGLGALALVGTRRRRK